MKSNLRAFGRTSLAVWLILAVTHVRGQDFERYRPKPPPVAPAVPQFPHEPKEVAGDTRQLVDSLRGIVLLDNPDRVDKVNLVEAEGLQFGSDADLYLLRSPEFRDVVQPYLDTPVSVRRLNELARDIIVFYRQHDQPVVDVIVPQQRITNGVVQLVVIEGRVGQIRVEGSCYFDPCFLANDVCTTPGERIYESQLLEDLRWLNRNPFREVDLELTPGAGFGETDIVFNVTDRKPFSSYAGYEDTGNRSIGLERMVAGCYWGNVGKKDHSLAYQFTASRYARDLNAHSMVYSFSPGTLNRANRDLVSIMASYALLDTDTLGAINTSGRSWQASIRYDHELHPGACQPRDCVHSLLTLGFDFKSTNSNLEFGGTNVFDSEADIVQFLVGVRRRKDHGCGCVSYLGADAFIGISGVTENNTSRAFNEIRPGATADYFYSRLFYEYSRLLRHDLVLFARVTGQIAEGNLLPSEQLGFGGYAAVRGYDMRLVNGDSGVLTNVEIQTVPRCLSWLPCGDHEFQMLAFFDHGDARNHTLLPGEDPSVDLSSVGLGFRLASAAHGSLRVDYGWPLNDVVVGLGDNARLHIGAVLRR